ncbi:unnamed protein product [Durusdinium trenchii]|uniref:Uncharacterized protein n=1 Tax=Durusdinium trenchii TaxID=1381693 RepID=A0ABP0NDC0_9DINO
MRIRSPTSSSRKLCPSSIRVLKLFEQWLLPGTPILSMRPRSRAPLHLAADAFAHGELSGFGGFVQLPKGRSVWFSERFSLTDLQPLGFSFKSDLQKEISALETLAQFMLFFVVTRHLKHARVALTLPSLSDNTGAESSSNRLFSTNLNHALILEKMALLSCSFNMFLDVSHIAKKRPGRCTQPMGSPSSASVRFHRS